MKLLPIYKKILYLKDGLMTDAECGFFELPDVGYRVPTAKTAKSAVEGRLIFYYNIVEKVGNPAFSVSLTNDPVNRVDNAIIAFSSLGGDRRFCCQCDIEIYASNFSTKPVSLHVDVLEGPVHRAFDVPMHISGIHATATFPISFGPVPYGQIEISSRDLYEQKIDISLIRGSVRIKERNDPPIWKCRPLDKKKKKKKSCK